MFDATIQFVKDHYGAILFISLIVGFFVFKFIKDLIDEYKEKVKEKTRREFIQDMPKPIQRPEIKPNNPFAGNDVYKALREQHKMTERKIQELADTEEKLKIIEKELDDTFTMKKDSIASKRENLEKEYNIRVEYLNDLNKMINKEEEFRKELHR